MASFENALNITQVKQAMTSAGYTMSPGNSWTGEDDKQYRAYCYFNHTGITPYEAGQGKAYSTVLPEGFPGRAGDEPGPGPDAELVSITISGVAELVEGGSSMLIATGLYDDETEADLTASAVWASSAEAVATVAGGTVTGVSEGTAQITATVGDVVSDAFEVTVAAEVVELVSLTIGGAPSIEEGASGTLTLTATYSDESQEEVDPAEATWASSDEEVVTVEAGEVLGIAEGVAQITAEIDGIESAPFELTVAPVV